MSEQKICIVTNGIKLNHLFIYLSYQTELIIESLSSEITEITTNTTK